MKSLYRKASMTVPDGLTKPTKSFRKHVWLSIAGLLLFIALYIALTIWFGKLAYRMFTSEGTLFHWVAGGCFAFLSLFMAKSLFFYKKRQENPMRMEMTAKDEPVLFDYLHNLADEAGAPRPHKVFLSDWVNASVSYNLSLLDLFIPSKKNLEIGLGLVNVLNLGELKAVLAHEFGHFAQRSMLLGRYVYVAQQVAAQIVNKRDIFDQFLNGISSIDIRIAWIGWILSILVWAVRSLIEVCFGIVVIAERALSREMEFQADLVAVSLTGSDALIHALYKLQIADQAYANAHEVVNTALGDKKAVHNMYTLQSNFIDKMSWVLGEPGYGKSPERATTEPEKHRVFSSRAYNPPQMWSTHPADKDREENAKRTYLHAEIDDTSSWELFSKPEEYQVEMTARLIKTANVETETISDEESLSMQNKEYFNWTFLDPKYNSAFLRRFPFSNFEKWEDMFDSEISQSGLNDTFTGLYPEVLNEKMNQLKEIYEEKDALVIAQNEAVTAEKRVIMHRGERVKRKEIPELLSLLKKEEDQVRDELMSHDKLARTAHYEAAMSVNPGWADYLKNLTALIHYAEHGIDNLNDCSAKFNNVLTVVLADGRVTSSELTQVVNACYDYYRALKKVFDHSKEIKPDAAILAKMDLESYADGFEEFKLPAPMRENINNWVNVVGGWANVALQGLTKLRNASLEQLVETEDVVRDAYRSGGYLPDTVPANTTIPKEYDTLLPGNERKIQRKLKFWDRFIVGDGLVPTVAKFAVSGLIIVGALSLGSFTQKSNFYIYNGLGIPVTVTIDEGSHTIFPGMHKAIEIGYGSTYDVVAKNSSGDVIEEMKSDFGNTSRTYVYNIANAGVFVEYPVYYGYDGSGEPTFLGSRRWFSTKADYILEEPPASLYTSSSYGERKDALTGLGDMAPERMIGLVEDEEELHKMIRVHAQWDNERSPHLMKWMSMLDSVTGPEIINARLERNPNEMVSLRALQDVSGSSQKEEVCNQHTKLSSEQPHNPDYFYLSTRCMEDADVQSNRFIEGYERWPEHPWLAFASASTFADREEWEKSYDAFNIAVNEDPNLRGALASQAERVKRVARLKFYAPLNEIDVSDVDGVAYYTSFDGDGSQFAGDDPDRAYYMMGQGQLEDAYSFMLTFAEPDPYLLRLLAASKGATPEMITAASELSMEEGMGSDSAWVALGMAARDNEDIEPYLTMVGQQETDPEMVRRFLNFLKQSRTADARQIIRDAEYWEKGYLFELGCIVLEDKVPTEWKDMANALLFVTERPYLGE